MPEMKKHPFLDTSFNIKWSRLLPECVEPDIDAALEEAKRNIAEIAGQSEDSVSYASTLDALENATVRLDHAWGLISHLDAVCNSDALRKAYNAVLAKVTDFYGSIPLNAELWKVIKAFSKTEEAKRLSPTRKRFLEETMAGFKAMGADLSSEQKRELEKVQSQLAQLTQKFSEHVLDATNAWSLLVDDESKLNGLPDSARAEALQNARNKGLGSEKQPVWRFTLQAPSMLPVLTYLDDPAVRKQVWEANNLLGTLEPYENGKLIKRILELRQQRAEILGKTHFPDLVLERRMAKAGKHALDFVEGLHAKTKPFFDKEVEALKAFWRKESNADATAEMEPWDIAYWSEKLRKKQYDFDEEALRPYFPMDKVIRGLFSICETIFGVKIYEKPSTYIEPGSMTIAPEDVTEVWHPDVKFYAVQDANGEHLGSFYADWYPRESKRGGAWMNHLITGNRANGKKEPHLGLMCGNMSAPVEGRPALLNHREVETVFHEFGHLLHHLLANVEVKSLSGTNVAWDFVELPSQIMENWCWERSSLDLFARHYETHATVPEDLFRKMVAARNFMSASFKMRQLSIGKIDLEMHLHVSDFLEGDLSEQCRAVLNAYTVKTATKPNPIVYRLTHVFSDPVGYASGYYSYKWAEVLDADAFTLFRQRGIMNPQVGGEFRKKILAKGNSEDPAKLYRDFMGRDPDATALLIRCGLI